MLISSCSKGLVLKSGFALVIATAFLVPRNVWAQTQATVSERVEVVGHPVASPTPHDDWKAKLDHIMSEVSGTQITVTKKATVIKLDQQPTVANNNLQQLYTKAPG